MPSRAPCPPGCGCRKHAARDRRKPTWPESKLAPCGSRAAYRRHLRRREQPCLACLEAERLRTPGRNAGSLTPDRREVRNGIPWKPYRYNGLGYDQITAWMDDDLEKAS